MILQITELQNMKWITPKQCKFTESMKTSRIKMWYIIWQKDGRHHIIPYTTSLQSKTTLDVY